MQVLALLRGLRMAMRELAVMLLTWWMESMAALRRVLIGRLLRARLEVWLPWEHQVTQVMLPRDVDPSLAEKVWAFSRSMRDTIGYWQEFGKRVNACGEQWGNNSFDW